MTPPLAPRPALLVEDLAEGLEDLDYSLVRLRDLGPGLIGARLRAVEDFRAAVGTFARAVRGWTDEEVAGQAHAQGDH